MKSKVSLFGIIFISLFITNANASDKELATKVIQNAITTIVMDKFSSTEVLDGVVVNIHRVFPTPSGSWTVRETGKCYADWNSGKTKCY